MLRPEIAVHRARQRVAALGLSHASLNWWVTNARTRSYPPPGQSPERNDTTETTAAVMAMEMRNQKKIPPL